MRTTITIDEDVAVRLERFQQERGISFKEAVNSTLRAGLDRSSPSTTRYVVPATRLGMRPGVNLDKALTLAAELEDQEIVEKLTRRK